MDNERIIVNIREFLGNRGMGSCRFEVVEYKEINPFNEEESVNYLRGIIEVGNGVDQPASLSFDSSSQYRKELAIDSLRVLKVGVDRMLMCFEEAIVANPDNPTPEREAER